MNKAVFLDRDGVINKERGDYTFRPEDFEFNKDVFEATKLLHNAGFLLFIITNQAGIAKGIYSFEDVEKLNELIFTEMKKRGILLSDIYYCPHHESFSACLCRKPGSLLFEKALATYNVDASKSFMIGDSDRDVEAAQKAGIKGIKIKPNEEILNICKEIVKNSQ